MQKLISLISGCVMFAAAGHAMAGSGNLTGYCDSSGDPNYCACPSGATCTTANFNQLTDASDGKGLHTAANVNATWNSSEGRWDVEIDVTAMAGEGMIVIDDQSGSYASAQDLFDHIGDILGKNLTATLDANDELHLPPMHIKQVGTSVRLYEDSNGHVTWAAENSRSLVYDAITDKDGKITIGGVTIFDLFGAGNGCDGTDTLSFDEASDGGLDVEQCSAADSGYGNPLDPNDCMEDFGKEICLTYYMSARTILETGYTSYFDSGTSPRFRCQFVGGVTPYRCDKTSSGGFTRVRQVADFMQLDSALFEAQVFTDDLGEDEVDENELVTDSSDDDGICSAGITQLGNVELPTETRDGEYDGSSMECMFE